MLAPPSANTELLAEPAPQLELTMRSTISPGAEVEQCRFVTVPETWVTRDVGQLAGGSHHMLVFQTPYTSIREEGDLLFLYNPLIAVPASGAARARWSCPIHADITIANVQSHMHSRGVGYEARIDGGGPFYVNDRWEGVPVQSYQGFKVSAGSRLDYACDYRNTSGIRVYQGPRTTDEMCLLVGSYYPADPRTSSCLDETGEGPGGDWIGQGTAICRETMRCLQSAADLRGTTDCMLAAAPGIARASSDLLHCFLGAKDPAARCGPQIAACAAR